MEKVGVIFVDNSEKLKYRSDFAMSKLKKVKVGVVGCGGIANGKHLPAMKRNGNFEIVAFCDLVEE